MSRAIDTLVIHVSYTSESEDIGAKEIRNWHVWPKENNDGTFKYQGKTYATKGDLPSSVRSRRGNGWADIGYHYVIRRDGALEDGRPNQEVGAHVEGHNKTSIGICLVGGKGASGLPAFNCTRAQMTTLRALVKFLKDQYDISPRRILGHRDFTNKKECPCFDVRHWYRTGVAK